MFDCDRLNGTTRVRRAAGLWIHMRAASASTLAVMMAIATPAHAQTSVDSANTPPASVAQEVKAGTAKPSAPDSEQQAANSDVAALNEVVVNGIRFRDTVLPTRTSSSSTYGLDLNVMDTPRSATLLSTTQLETLNLKDPRAFSYLTSSAYTDSGFGTPNIPRIRGQYGDVFINGMRYSFTNDGYGMPLNFDSLDTVNINKGPASVVDGPGPGVGGQADFITKRPSVDRDSMSGSGSIDSIGNRRVVTDLSVPLVPGKLGLLISYSGEYSDSYFTDHFFHKSAVYAALRWEPTDDYRVDFNTEVNYERFTENAGLNRVSQDLIDNQIYLRGAPSGELYSATFGGDPLPIGSPGNPFSPAAPFLTTITLGNPTKISTKTTIDETPGTVARALLFNAQLIQSLRLSDGLSLHNNTFFNYMSNDNHTWYYYDDGSRGSFTVENRTTMNYDSSLPWGIGDGKSQFVVGADFRFQHIDTYLDWNIETPNIFDLTTNPNLWKISDSVLRNYGDSFTITSGLGKTQLAVPGRDPINNGATGVSNLYDGALFIQHRAEFSPKISVLYGSRVDLVEASSHDPIGGATCCEAYGSSLPQDHSTKVYGLVQGNTSVVYKPMPWLSSYFTYDYTESTLPNGAYGGINAYGQVPDKNLLRTQSELFETGLKFNLLDNKLYVGSAIFDQKRDIPIGQGTGTTSRADIRGAELEINYQPTSRLFATASYSYLKTTLNRPATFYNYPAEAGTYVDGAGLYAVFAAGQKFNDPGIPRHLFNVLANYKLTNGLGVRSGVQVTGPLDLTQSGQLDLAASQFVPASVIAKGGYYQSPRIPWQYTWNAAVFYEFGAVTATLSAYNITDRLNWQATPPYYGNDFLVRSDPRTVELRIQAKY
ncbi:MAG TPA: TonB-dependent receptor plug domain-containing protein [Steroidobacteraceae bacterium]|nr:TonB-dependent receptor plug domain-containing protein [Steroidobacteraceae bacterium]